MGKSGWVGGERKDGQGSSLKVWKVGFSIECRDTVVITVLSGFIAVDDSDVNQTVNSECGTIDDPLVHEAMRKRLNGHDDDEMLTEKRY